ncbi:hypothetical protein AT246_06845 [Bartonella henselae]|uniref:BepF n=1 Tax=Bartonella henselae TaxID=38323 RepID=I3QKD9_BARHN|nr:BID domain-containing T4SS effector [Bartonella henselae]AFK10361.1 BepF [Bartonella henselae]MDM9996708.1 BID domain-containing T4SS effector [Bartonella henselae]OLL51667.1 hypothetical protein AT243_06400 [Bartonella henselae]OLL57942.1 hypothetical protein AT246_06845 [Bartonella henselae]UJM43769.1 BID domain-containing T4SS effector [Bartonella henselae]
MKKNQPSSSTSPSVKELKKRYEQTAAEASTLHQLSAGSAPKEKKQPSSRLEELRKRYEQTASLTASQEALSARGFPKEKRQPHTQQSPEKLPIHHEQQFAVTPQQSSLQTPLYATPLPQQPVRTPPQRPPRAKDKELHKTAPQDSTPLYATPAPHKQQPMRERAQSNTSSQDNEPLYATAAPSQSPRMEEKSVNTMQRNLLLEAYKEEIKYWCGIVYGDRLILQKRIEEIQENPALGEQLSWEVSEHPKSISKLAGKKMLGVKTKARRKAEENYPALRDTIDGYVYTLKYSQQRPLHAPHTEHTRDEQQPHRTQSAEKERAPLSNQELANRIRTEPSVLYSQTEVQYWSKIVFGNPYILQYRIEDIQKNPDMGEEFSWQIANNPSLFSPLAGKRILGIKNDARRYAEASLSCLCSAIEGYADAVKQTKEDIVQEYQVQQSRQELSAEPAKQLQKQQTLSKPHKLPEHSPTDAHQETTQTSMQTEWERLGARPRTVTTHKKHTQESTLPTSHAEQKTTREQTTENQQKSLTHEKEKTPLSHKEIASRVQNDLSVQRAQIEIYNWCNIVYNNPLVLQHTTEDIKKIPILGEELSWQVANFSTIFAPLAGRQVLGIKNNARKHAEEAIPSLCTAIDHYTEIVKQVREDIVKNHQEQSPKKDKNVKRQQSLSESPKLPERSTEIPRHQALEASRQAQQKPSNVRSSEAEKTQKMVLAL